MGRHCSLLLANQRCLLPACNFAHFPSRTSSEAIPNLEKNPPKAVPRSLRTLDCTRSFQLLVTANMVSIDTAQPAPRPRHRLIAHMRSLSHSQSTGKSQRQRTNGRTAANRHSNIITLQHRVPQELDHACDRLCRGLCLGDVREAHTIRRAPEQDEMLTTGLTAVSTPPWTRSGTATTEA